MASRLGRNKGGGRPANTGPTLRLVRPGGGVQGLSREVIEEIAWQRNEPDWMRRKRLQAYEVYERLALPTWGPDLSTLDLGGLDFLAEPTLGLAVPWRAEHVRLHREIAAKGVTFAEMGTAVARYPEVVREHFMTRNVPVYDNKLAALNGAVWSDGWFVHVPAGASISLPVEALYGSSPSGFAHTLIIAEPGSTLEFVVGSLESAERPRPLCSAVVEVFVKDGARVRFVHLENEPRGTYVFATRRALLTGEGAEMEWIDVALGGATTMHYPGSRLVGRGSRARHNGLWVASAGQRKDVGARVIHQAAHTLSSVTARALATGGGQVSVRGIVRVSPGAAGARVELRTDTLVLDEGSRADSCPDLQIHQSSAVVQQQTTASNLSAGRLRELEAEGLSAAEARARVLSGFIAPAIHGLPADVALEVDRLVRG